jgi:hypothetical protein
MDAALEEVHERGDRAPGQTWVCADCGTATTAAFPTRCAPRWPMEAEVDFIMEGSQKHEACYI